MHILTCGDSWSKGEWDKINNNHDISHQGINQYFRNSGHNVTNIHRFSNKDSIEQLNTYLENNSPDLIFYFFTDPFRDLTDPNDISSFVDFNQKANTLDKFLLLHKSLLKKSLKKLDKIGKKIYVLGGCQRLKKEKYKNIKILVESISELVNPNYQHPAFWDSGWSCFLNFERIGFDKELFNLVEKEHKLQWKMETDEFAEMFRPDGLHPNRHAHFKLYNFLKETIDELK
jgi:hypothetical protein